MPTIALGTIVLALAAAAAAADGRRGPGSVTQQTPTFGSTVSVTRVKAAVLDRDGRAVTDLSADDFRVYDAGEEREVTVMLAPDRSPLELVVVPDFSGSIADSWPDARRRVEEFLDALDPSDCVYLLPFNTRVGPGFRAAADHPVHRLLVERFPMAGSTRLYDALFAAYTGLRGPQGDGAPMLTGSTPCPPPADGERRRAIVALTDGADAGSAYSYRDVLMQAWRAEVPLFPVAVGVAALSESDLAGYRTLGATRAETDAVATTQRQLGELARVSGGRMVTQRDIRDGYAEVLALLRGYYVLGYRTPQPRREGWHEVDVRLREPDGRRVVFQPGYYSAAADPGDALAALERGQALLAQRRFAEALRVFDEVGRSGLEVGFADLGAGLAHEGLGQLDMARRAYLRELERNPGLGTAHARLARLAVRQGDVAAAVKHAVIADVGGVDVDDLIGQLRSPIGAPAFAAAYRRPVVFLVRPEEPGLEAQLLLGDVLRAIGNRIEGRNDVILTRNAATATHYLRLVLDRVEPSDFRARIELWSAREERRLADEDVRLAVRPPPAAGLAEALGEPLAALLRELEPR